MNKIYKLSEAAKYLDIYPKTLQRWDRDGWLVAHRTQTNRRYYTQEQLDNWLNKKHETAKKEQVAYARVSSPHQRNNLKNQMSFIRNYCNAKGIILDEEISDIGSGLNYKRPKWNKLLKEVEQGKVGTIYITYKDRFIRFGFDWFEQFCQDHGCQIVVLNNPNTSPEEEITQDLLSIIHVFSCRSYGLRKYKKQIKTMVESKEKDD
jgi:putative resolvase